MLLRSCNGVICCRNASRKTTVCIQHPASCLSRSRRTQVATATATPKDPGTADVASTASGTPSKFQLLLRERLQSSLRELVLSVADDQQLLHQADMVAMNTAELLCRPGDQFSTQDVKDLIKSDFAKLLWQILKRLDSNMLPMADSKEQAATGQGPSSSISGWPWDELFARLQQVYDALVKSIGRGPHLNPYQMSNYAPVLDLNLPSADPSQLASYSYQSPALAPIEGRIPEELQGYTYVAVGPNSVYGDPDEHWFDGDGCMHACTLESPQPGGSVSAFYARSLVSTVKLRTELKAGKAIFLRMGAMHGAKTIPYMIRACLLIAANLLHLIPEAYTSSGTSSSAMPSDPTPLASSLGASAADMDGYEWVVDQVVKALTGYMTANIAPLLHRKQLFALHELDLPYEMKVTKVMRQDHLTAIKVNSGKLLKDGFALGNTDPGTAERFTAHPRIAGPVKGTDKQFVAGFTYDGGNLNTTGKYRLRLFDHSRPLSKGLVADVGIEMPIYGSMADTGAGLGQTMVHDIGTTENYIIVINTPVFFDLETSLKEDYLAICYKKEFPLRLGVIRIEDVLRATQAAKGRSVENFKDIQWFEARMKGSKKGFSGVLLHVAESWEESLSSDNAQPTRVKLIGTVFPGLDLKRVVTDEPAQLFQFSMDVSTAATSAPGPAVAVMSPVIKDSSATFALGEFPVSSSQQPGPSQYIFLGASAAFLGAQTFDGIVKVDVAQGRVAGKISYSRQGELKFASGQPTFIPIGDKDDGTGYLVTFVYDASQDAVSYMGKPRGKSEFVIYNAATMSSKPVARVPLGARVPYYFHALCAAPQNLKLEEEMV